VIPKAPNKRLELQRTADEIKLDRMDLYDLLQEFGLTKKDK